MEPIDPSLARRTGQAPSSKHTDPKLSKHDKSVLVERLSKFAMFNRCSTDDLAALVDVGSSFVLPANWPLMLDSTPAHTCYAITDGSAKVFINRVQVGELGPGDIVGEMAILTGDLRRATVTSTTRLRGLRVDNTALVGLFERRPQLLDVLRGAYVMHTPPSHRERIRDILRAAAGGLTSVTA